MSARNKRYFGRQKETERKKQHKLSPGFSSTRLSDEFEFGSQPIDPVNTEGSPSPKAFSQPPLRMTRFQLKRRGEEFEFQQMSHKKKKGKKVKDKLWLGQSGLTLFHFRLHPTTEMTQQNQLSFHLK